MAEEAALAQKEDAASTSEAPPSKLKDNARQLALRIALGTAGLLLVVGFFLPWVTLPQIDEFSGLELAVTDNLMIRNTVGDWQRWVLGVLPVLGAGLTAIGFLGFRWSGPVAAIVGLLIILYGIVVTVAIFFQTTKIGLWLTLAGAFLAVGVGVFTWIRAHRAKKQRAPTPDVSLPDLDD